MNEKILQKYSILDLAVSGHGNLNYLSSMCSISRKVSNKPLSNYYKSQLPNGEIIYLENDDLFRQRIIEGLNKDVSDRINL